MRLGLIALLLVLSIGAVAAAVDDPVVVVNSKDWHDIYLGTVHANHIGADLLYFTSLGDAQIKTQTVHQDRPVTVLESARPVVKNYESVLRTNGFTTYEVIEYENYRDLQLELFDGEYAGVVVLDPTFGVEAIALSPRIGTEILRPFFLDETNGNDLERASRGFDETIVAGYFPIRLIEDIDASESYTGMSSTNANIISRSFANGSDATWGTIMRIDRVDFVGLLQNRPVVIYAGSISDTVEVVREIPLDRYEIISADAANLGPQIEEGVGRDLSFMLKYGRTITNLPGLTGQILDLDTVFVDYPSPDLVIDSIEHYEDANALLVTYRNRGNINTLSLTNIEYADNALTDTHVRTIHPQETIEVPYPLDVAGFAVEAFINARYGMTIPLSNTLLSEQGTQLVRQAVTRASSDNLTLDVERATYDDEKGVLSISVRSGSAGVARIEVPVSDELTFTSGAAEAIEGTHTFLIRTPYHRADVFGDEIEVHVYQGTDAPVYTNIEVVDLEIARNLLTGSVTAIASGALIMILLALIVGLVLYVRSRR